MTECLFSSHFQYMSDSSDKTELLGFLTVIEHVPLGRVGGFLVLNQAGRPVEFHCTSPVRANRAQEILYGSSLYPFLYGEQIAGTLVSKTKSPVTLLLTDSIPVLAVQESVDLPVVYVCARKREEGEQGERGNEQVRQSLLDFGIENAVRTDEDTEKNEREKARRLHDIPGLSVARWREIECGNQWIGVPAGNEEELEIFRRRFQRLAKTLDIAEPFERIRLAVEETQKAA